jgi:hypothetical protein
MEKICHSPMIRQEILSRLDCGQYTSRKELKTCVLPDSVGLEAAAAVKVWSLAKGQSVWAKEREEGGPKPALVETK